MVALPAHPLAPELGPDMMVRLTPVQQYPRVGHSPRPRGDQLLPGQSALEQEIAWVFPVLASSPITPRSLREHLDKAFCFAFGALAHRVILERVPLRDDWAEAIPNVGRQIDAFVRQSTAEPVADTLKLVANLEMSADLFGPASEWQFKSIWWGMTREFALAQQFPAEGYSTMELVRYQSMDNLVEQQTELIGSRIGALIRPYFDSAFDIVALWNAQPGLAHRATTRQRQERNRSLMQGALSTVAALSAASDAASRRRSRDALTAQRRAQASYLRRR